MSGTLAASLLLGVYLAIFSGVIWYYYPPRYRRRKRQVLVRGIWEVIAMEENTEERGMVKIRWSMPDATGKFLWVGHYGYGGHGLARHTAEYMAETHCKRLNELGRMPYEFKDGTNVPISRYEAINSPRAA